MARKAAVPTITDPFRATGRWRDCPHWCGVNIMLTCAAPAAACAHACRGAGGPLVRRPPLLTVKEMDMLLNL